MTSDDAQFAATQNKVARDRLRNAIPNRVEGEPIALGTIRNTLLNKGTQLTDPQLELAIGKLVARGFLDQSDFPQWFFTPTPVGDALITTITGASVKKASIPDLPNPTWVG